MAEFPGRLALYVRSCAIDGSGSQITCLQYHSSIDLAIAVSGGLPWSQFTKPQHMKNLWLILTGLLLAATTTAQNSNSRPLQEQVYQAYIANNVDLWEKAILSHIEQHGAKPTGEDLLQLAKLEYGVVGVCMGNENEKKAKEHLVNAERYLKSYLKQNKNSAEAHAVMSGVLGFRIAFSPMSGMWLGPRSNSHLKKAMNANRDCAQAWRQKAGSLFHTPARLWRRCVRKRPPFQKGGGIV